ncbi:MAG: PAS domain S-box protein, partial [Anaerolineales bacterium]|nr:PAS domain S-box protein [Anaerolineales bacterium]
MRLCFRIYTILGVLFFIFSSTQHVLALGDNISLLLIFQEGTQTFWQTWWFAAVIIVILAGAIALGFQWRVRAVKEDARRLEILVQQRTSELSAANDQLEIEIEQRKRAEEALAKRAAEELEQSEARFRAMFENAAIGIGLVGLDRRPLEVNAALVQMTGYSAEELYQMTGMDLSYEEDAEVGLPELQAVLASNSQYGNSVQERGGQNGMEMLSYAARCM